MIINDNIENYSLETADIYDYNKAYNWLTNTWGDLDAELYTLMKDTQENAVQRLK